jgi:hypothetical protein
MLLLLFDFTGIGDRPVQQARDLPPASAPEQSSGSTPDQSSGSKPEQSSASKETQSPQANSASAIPVDPGPEKSAAPQTVQSPPGPPEARDSAQRQAGRSNEPQQAAGTPTPADPDVPSRAKGPPMYNQPPGLAVKGGRLLGKLDMVNSTKCYRMCLEDVTCVAYTARPGNHCDLFASPGAIVAEPGALSGTKYSN